MRSAWTEDTLTFHGQYTNVDNLWVLPKPCSNPAPLYVATSTSPSTVEWAASQRIQPILGGPTDIMGQAPQVLKMWRDKMEEFGHPHAHLPAHGQGDLCHTDDGRGPARPDWPGRFFLAHSALSEDNRGHDWHANR